jgi:probable nitrogen fixation protein
MKPRMSVSQKTSWEVSGFLDVLVKKMRAYDPYGALKKLDDVQVLSQYVKTKEEKKQIDTTGQVDVKTMWRIRMFYEAIAMLAEENTSQMCYAAVDVGYEGFGRAFVITGGTRRCRRDKGGKSV